MDRDCPDKVKDEGRRRIRTGHRKQSHGFYTSKIDDKMDGIQKQILEKNNNVALVAASPILKPAINNSLEKQSLVKSIVKSEKQYNPISSPKKYTKCDYFPATCTINLCPSCRILECNMKNGAGKHMTMKYDNPDYNLVTTKPEGCVGGYVPEVYAGLMTTKRSNISPSYDRNGNRSPSRVDARSLHEPPQPSRVDARSLHEPPQRCSSRYALSPPKLAATDSLKSSYKSPSSTSNVCKRHSTPTPPRNDTSPKRTSRYLIPKVNVGEKGGSESCQYTHAMLPISKDATGTKPAPSVILGDILKKRRIARPSNYEHPSRKSAYQPRLASASPTTNRSHKMATNAEGTETLSFRSRQRTSAPTGRYDRKPPLPAGSLSPTKNSTLNIENDFPNEKLYTNNSRYDSYDDPVSQDATCNIASNNQYHLMQHGRSSTSQAHTVAENNSSNVAGTGCAGDVSVIKDMPRSIPTSARRECTDAISSRDNSKPTSRDCSKSIARDCTEPTSRVGAASISRDCPKSISRDYQKSISRDGPMPSSRVGSISRDCPKSISREGPKPRSEDCPRSSAGDCPNLTSRVCSLPTSRECPKRISRDCIPSKLSSTRKLSYPGQSLKSSASTLKAYTGDRGSNALIMTPSNGTRNRLSCITYTKSPSPRHSSVASQYGCPPMPVCKPPMLSRTEHNKCFSRNTCERPLLQLNWPDDFGTIFRCLLYVTKVMVGVFFIFLALCVFMDHDSTFAISLIAIVTVLVYFFVIRPTSGPI